MPALDFTDLVEEKGPASGPLDFSDLAPEQTKSGPLSFDDLAPVDSLSPDAGTYMRRPVTPNEIARANEEASASVPTDFQKVKGAVMNSLISPEKIKEYSDKAATFFEGGAGKGIMGAVSPLTNLIDLAGEKAAPEIRGELARKSTELAASFVSPAGIATMGLGALPKAVQTAVGYGFAADLLSQAPEAADAILNAKTPKEKTGAIFNAATLVGMGGGIVAGHLAARPGVGGEIATPRIRPDIELPHETVDLRVNKTIEEVASSEPPPIVDKTPPPATAPTEAAPTLERPRASVTDVVEIPLSPEAFEFPEGATGMSKLKVGGTTGTVVDYPDRVVLKDIVTLKDQEGQGGATAVIDSLKEKGKPIELVAGGRETDTPIGQLRKFYSNRGFTEVSERRFRWEPEKATEPSIDSRIAEAYKAIVDADPNHIIDVNIVDLQRESGIPLDKLHEWLLKKPREFSIGDQAFPAPGATEAAVNIKGEPHRKVRLTEDDFQKLVGESAAPKWSEATSSTAEAAPEKEGVKLGVAPPGLDILLKAVDNVKSVAKEVSSLPVVSDLRKSILRFTAKSQKSFGEIAEAQKTITKAVKSPIRRAAITNYIEANGDLAELKNRELASADKTLREGYKAAQSLTADELAIAKQVRDAFDALHARGVHYDILDSFRDNYVNHIWEKKPDRLTFGSRTLKNNFRFAKARTFNSFFEGEQAGFKPKTKDIAKLLPVYLHEMNSAIAARQLVQEMSSGVASDGRPLVSPRGNVKEVETPEGKAYLVSPKVPKDLDVSDYRSVDQQALQKWVWRGKDEAGNPIFINADLALHPEAYARMKNLLGNSEIKNWYNSPGGELASIPKAIAKGIDNAQSTMKQTMLGLLSTFHQVQEGTHAIGHRVSPLGFVRGGATEKALGTKLPDSFSIPKIDLASDPKQMDAANHGLMLNPDRISERVFMEGVGQTGIISKIPGLGKVADMYANYLFHQYIPGLKFKTYEAMVDRNMKVFKKEVVSGKATEEQIKILSAQQANAAYGHLNYADLGRNPTMQHLMQLTMLAPDFLEARGRFTAQAIKGAAGLKVGREQLLAVGFLAVTQFALSKIISKLADDDWHFDKPFEVVVGDRTYTLRSVPEDVYSLIKDSRRFAYGRISPLLGKGAIQMMTGLNYRGEKTTAMETLGELLTQYIPLSVRSFPEIRDLTTTSRNRTVTPLEEFAGTMGVRASRYSPISEIYKKASKWQEEQGTPKDRGSYPISKYQQLRYALEDGDIPRAQEEYTKLRKDMAANKIADGFKESINHPFTGSKASDAKFRGSLKEEDQKLFDLAVEKRRHIYDRFNRLQR